MENEMTGYILTLLENYAKTTNEIELLRYELQHCNIVSPEEMIETLALSRRENNPDSRYPHDVAGIAMCFREVTDRLNKDASNEVAAQYVALVRERERLQYYISLLEHRESTALKEHYFFQKSWTEIAKNLALPEELSIKYALRPSTIWQASTDLQSKCFVYREKVFQENKCEQETNRGIPMI